MFSKQNGLYAPTIMKDTRVRRGELLRDIIPSFTIVVLLGAVV